MWVLRAAPRGPFPLHLPLPHVLWLVTGGGFLFVIPMLLNKRYRTDYVAPNTNDYNQDIF